MAAPFIYGKPATESNFTNRTTEIEQLIFNFTSLTSTVLISPRRWGKSSLVAKAAGLAQIKNKNLKFCVVDLYNVRSEEQFYQLLAQEVLRVSSTKMNEVLKNARKFMGQFIPKVSFGADSASGISIGLDWKEVKKNPDDILNLCEKIALEKGFKFIVCIDEFQHISEFPNQLSIQKN